MTSIAPTPRALTTTRALLQRLIELPDLARTLPALPAPTFSALIRAIGVEDAGELVALATPEQLAHAFDEDWFVNDRAGEREALDPARFVAWLEALLEAGDAFAADRIAALDEDLVAHALSHLVLVLDEDALRERLTDADEDEARHVDKALDSALTEDLDGYLLVAKRHEGWDAALSLILALDRDHRPLLVRLLDRLAAVIADTLDDLDELSTVLNDAESLAEDAEAAREARRSRQGYVEPQAARAFLALARKPTTEDERRTLTRDPLTRAYFRELERGRHGTARRGAPEAATAERAGGRGASSTAVRALPEALLGELEAVGGAARVALAETADAADAGDAGGVMRTFLEALRELGETDPQVYEERVEELAYLANVLLAGHEREGRRLTPKEAAEAAMATVCWGVVVEVRERSEGARGTASREALLMRSRYTEVLRRSAADFLFRRASASLVGGAPESAVSPSGGVFYSAAELDRIAAPDP